MKGILFILIQFIACTVCHAQVLPKVNIWEGTGKKANVSLTPYLASGNDCAAVIVCPGGSYFWHDTENEGTAVCEWLQKNGISAFLLNYRTAYVPAFIFHHRLIFRGNQYPDSQDDLQQAIAYVKDHASAYRIDTTRVGAMGFSAGGHLVMSVAEMYQSPLVRPAFVVPVYPVVTLVSPYVHKRSRRGLLGEYRKFNQKWREALSLELHVPDDCPPVFLVNCKDDPIVKYQNSILLDQALTAKHIDHKYLFYQTGGHGFGASETKGTPECRAWKDEFIAWFNEHFSKGGTK